MPKDEFDQTLDYFNSKKNDYKTYNIKQVVENLISPEQVSADEILSGINLLPDINNIKKMKKTIQLLYKAGVLNKKNLALIADEINFNQAISIHSILNHLFSNGLLNQANLEWILTANRKIGLTALNIDILDKNGLLNEKSLQALKSGKLENLPSCIQIMRPLSFKDLYLTRKTMNTISGCADAAVELGTNPFKLTTNFVYATPPLEIKNDTPIANAVNNESCCNFSISALNIFLLSVNYTLGLFKKGNSFPKTTTSCIENPYSSRLEELDRLEQTVNAAIKKYQDKPRALRNKEALTKTTLSPFFIGNYSSENIKKEEAKQQDKVVSARR